MTRAEAIETYQMTIEALKKQVPMKPTAHEKNYTINYKCPKCGCGLMSKIDGECADGAHYPYCCMCGQRIDWEGVE